MPELERFRLVGGTALALQLGHRISVDLDFFTEKRFDELELENSLRLKHPDFQIVTVRSTGFSAIIRSVKCDFYNWSVPFIRPAVLESELRLAHLEEIAPMKFDAILRRQEKKDFIDIYFLMQRYSIGQLVQFYKEKYPFQDIKPVFEFLPMPDLADDSLMPAMLVPIPWEEIKTFIVRTYETYLEHSKTKRQEQLQERLKKAQNLLDQKKKGT